MEYQFCGVFLLKKKLYIVRQEEVRGAGRIVMPLKEVRLNIDADALHEELLAALDDYRRDARPVTRNEVEKLNDELLEVVGEKSVAAFERKKKDVTIRREIGSGEIRLFKANGQEATGLDLGNLGHAIKSFLELPG